MSGRLGLMVAIVAIFGMVAIGAGPWGVRIPGGDTAPVERRSSSQPTAEQQAQFNQALPVITILTGSAIVSIVVLIGATSIYLRKRRSQNDG
jgi:hypothetical protein